MQHMDWDDIRFYLAVARHGSIRAASNQLSVNPSTVARRIDAYEKKIGVRLFDRLATGYILTKTGQDMLNSAELIENEIASLDRRVTGSDAQLNGKLRVTLPAPIATHLLMHDIAEFEQAYPGINLELHVSYEVLNLSKREADIAIRMIDTPTENLTGNKIGSMAFATYASKEYLNTRPKDKAQNMQWIQHKAHENNSDWQGNSKFKDAPIKHTISDPFVLFQAVKANMGIAKLPCFMADADNTLQRIDEIEKTGCGGDIWLLTHKDLSNTARVKVFLDFMTKAFKQHEEKLKGNITAAPSTIWQAQSRSA